MSSKQLENSELVGKNNPKGGVSGDSSNDKVHFKLALNTTSYKAVVGAGSSDKPIQILGAVRSAPEFANNNAKVKEALTATQADSRENSK